MSESKVDNTVKFLPNTDFFGKTIKDIDILGNSGIIINFTDDTSLELQADYDFSKEYATLLWNK